MIRERIESIGGISLILEYVTGKAAEVTNLRPPPKPHIVIRILVVSFPPKNLTTTEN